MAKLLAEKPIKSQVEIDLESLNNRERMKRKSQLICESCDQKYYDYKGLTFLITEGPKASKVAVKLSVDVYDKEKKLSIDNPLIIVNPPTKVPDGTAHIEKDEFGNDVEVDNFEFNPSNALKEVIYQVVQQSVSGG